MKANELRIGNWVYNHEPRKEYLLQVESGNQIDFESEYYLPIPLTEEWLLKFGFKTVRNSFLSFQLIYEQYGLHFKVFKNGVISFVLKDRNGKDEYRQINHVHQLQNLYFALTGEEL